MKTLAIIKNIVLVLMILCSFNSYSQSTIQKAKELKNNFDYQKAIVEYNNYFETHTPTAESMRDLVECYYQVNNLASAEVWLKKIIDSGDFSESDVWKYAVSLKTQAKYSEAIIQFKNYASMKNACNVKASAQIEGCMSAISWINNPTFYEVFNEKDLNTENSEFGLIKFGSNYILTSDRKYGKVKDNEIYGWTGKPYLKLYSVPATGKASLSSGIKIIGGLNNKFHNGPGNYNVSNSAMFFTRTKMVKVANKPINTDPTSWVDESVAPDYINRLEIFYSNYTQSEWQAPIAFEYNNAAEYSVGHPAITVDGKTMYFVSDMPGGYGSTDIYYCEKLSDGKWSKPINAGPVINSYGKEVFPFVDDDGALYFSSDGHAGMGGLDIFLAIGEKSNWSKPENLKYPINSPMDDFSIYFTETSNTGFFSSNRDGGLGDDDIYSFEYLPPKSLILAITTKEKLEDNSLVIFPNIDLSLTNKNQESTENYISDNTGRLYVDLNCPDSYELTGFKEGYSTTSSFFNAICKTRNDTMYVDMIFDKTAYDVIVIENIYYDFDKWNIRPDAAIELDKIVNLLKLNPDVTLELGSHTDCRGTDQYNQVLSDKRAKSAIEYIISQGISQNRLTYKGYGESELRNKCLDGVECSEAEHQLNRRTEFKVTGGVLKKH